MEQQKAVVIISGGMDSSVLLATVKKDNPAGSIKALTIDYGQRHSREIACAQWQCRAQNVPHMILDVASVFRQLGGSVLTEPLRMVPHGHYSEENMKKTVVPNRNMVLLSLAIAVAVKEKAQFVAYGAHAGDHAIYPDCRPEFAEKMNEVAKIANWQSVELLRPFIGMTKADIVKRGALLGVDFIHTWSCYEGEHEACGKCGTCVERLEAFDIAGCYDPLLYSDRQYWKSVCHRGGA